MTPNSLILLKLTPQRQFWRSWKPLENPIILNYKNEAVKMKQPRNCIQDQYFYLGVWGGLSRTGTSIIGGFVGSPPCGTVSKCHSTINILLYRVSQIKLFLPIIHKTPDYFGIQNNHHLWALLCSTVCSGKWLCHHSSRDVTPWHRPTSSLQASPTLHLQSTALMRSNPITLYNPIQAIHTFQTILIVFILYPV